MVGDSLFYFDLNPESRFIHRYGKNLVWGGVSFHCLSFYGQKLLVQSLVFEVGVASLLYFLLERLACEAYSLGDSRLNADDLHLSYPSLLKPRSAA